MPDEIILNDMMSSFWGELRAEYRSTAGRAELPTITPEAVDEAITETPETAESSYCNWCGQETPTTELTHVDNELLCNSCRSECARECSQCGSPTTATCYQSEETRLCYTCGEGTFRCLGCSNRLPVAESNEYGFCSACWTELPFEDQVNAALPVIHPDNDYTPPPNRTASESFPFKRSLGQSEANSLVGSDRTYGIEIETSASPQGWPHETAFRPVSDCSVTGWEFVSTILQGNQGFREIKQFCGLADLSNFSVNDQCGLHLHYSVDEPELTPLVNAYARTETFWHSFVNSRRRSYRFCIPFPEDPSEVFNGATRYFWVNPLAYRKHGTIEIRLMNGTLRSDLICAWVQAHLAFSDYVATGETLPDNLFSLFSRDTAAVLEFQQTLVRDQ